MNNYNSEILAYRDKLIDTLKHIDVEIITKVVKKLVEVLTSDGTIYVFGNGGSASTASHLQNDFNKGISQFSSKKFKVCCLSDNVALMTAIANDISYDEIFRYQLNGRLKKNDLIIAISCSGNSRNVLNAASYAKSMNVPVISFTGFKGGELIKYTDYNLNVKIEDMQITEDIHLMFIHLITAILIKEFQISVKKD